MNINGSLVTEKNYSILNKNVDIWNGELPFKRGDKFPTKEMRERADISNTNRLLYENDMDEILNTFLTTFIETDPLYGWQLKELMARLPYNKTTVDYYAAMISGFTPFVNGTDKVDTILNTVVENSNLPASILEETRSRFLDQFSVYRMYTWKGTAKLQKLPSKNCVAFVNSKCTNEIEVVVVFNIYKTEFGNDVCEFIEYHDDGKVVKRVFNYSNGILGKELVEKRQEGMAFEGLNISPIIFCRHNVLSSGDIYGCDMFRYWNSSIVMAMRELQNIFRYDERCREIIRQVPNNALDKDNVTGRTLFVNRGTVPYNADADQKPDMKYVQPDPNMMVALINAFDAAMDTVSNSTGLGKVFFGIEKAGSNISAKSIEAMLYPTRLLVTLIRNELNEFIKEACTKMCAISGLGDIVSSDISINWRNSFPYDEAEHTNAIIERYNAKLLSRADAIVLLDDVPLRIAKQRAAELAGLPVDDDSVTIDRIDTIVEEHVEDSETNDVNTGSEFVESGATDDGDGAEHTNGDDLNNPKGPAWEYERLLL